MHDRKDEHEVPLLKTEVKEAPMDSDEKSSELESKSTETTELLVGRPSAVSKASHITSLPGAHEDRSEIPWDAWVRALRQDQLRSHYQRFITWMTMDSWAIKVVVAWFVRQHHMRQPGGSCCVGALHCLPAPRSNAWPLYDLRAIRRINVAVSCVYAIEWVAGHLWSWTLLAFKLNDAYNQLFVDRRCGPHGIQQWLQDAPSYSLVSNLLLNPNVLATVGGGMLVWGALKASSTWYSLKRVKALNPEQLSITTTSTDGRTRYDIQVGRDAAPASRFLAGSLAWGEHKPLSWCLLDHQANKSRRVLNATGRHLLQAVIEDQNAADLRLAFLRHTASQQDYYPLPPYQSSRWGDSCGVLLPWGQTSSALTHIARSLMWDGTLSFNERRLQLDYLQHMACNGHWIAACSAISELATIAHAHNLRDLDQLLCEGLLSRPQYNAQFTTKARALAILHHLNQQSLTVSTALKNLWISYNLWHLGHNRSVVMHLAFWPIKGWKFYAKVMLFIRLFQSGYALIKAFKDCEQQERFWIYVPEIKNYICTVCYDFNVPSAAAWKDVSCWEALLSSPQFPSTVVRMIQRVHMSAIQQADFSRQKLDDSFVQAVFPALAQHTHSLPTIILGSATQPVHIRLNQSAIILAQALEVMSTTNLTVYWDDHPVISVFVEHFPRTLRYANLLPQLGKHLYISGQSAAGLSVRLPVDTLSLSFHKPELVPYTIPHYVLCFEKASNYYINLPFVATFIGNNPFLNLFLDTLQTIIHVSKLRHLKWLSLPLSPNFSSSIANILKACLLLETLDMSGSPIPGYKELGRILGHKTSLKAIYWNGSYIDDQIARDLIPGLSISTTIQIITLIDNLIVGPGLKEWSHMTTLKYLDISRDQSPWGLGLEYAQQFLLNGVSHNVLSFLNVSHNSIGFYGLNQSLWTETFCQLQGVIWDISYNYFPLSFVKALYTIAAKQNNTLIGFPQYLFSKQDIVTLFHSNCSEIDFSNSLIECRPLVDNRTSLIAQELALDSSLHGLNLNHNCLGARNKQGLQALAQSVRHSNSLQYLGVRNNGMSAQSKEALIKEVRYSRSLKYIDISENDENYGDGCNVTKLLAQSLSLYFPCLQHLDIHKNAIGGYCKEEVRDLGISLGNSSLQYLSISLNLLGFFGIQNVKVFLTAVRKNTFLQYLNISYTAINCAPEYSQDIFYFLIDMLPYSHLKVLDLSFLNDHGSCMNDLTLYAISNTTAHQLLLAAINSTLDVMNLTGSLNIFQIQPLADFLQPFRRPPEIYNFSQHLNTSILDQSFRAEIGQRQIADIASHLSHINCNWTTLKLAWSSINDTGVKLLAPQLRHSHVTTIDLRYNEITDDGAQDLAKALVSDLSASLCRIPFLDSLTSAQHKTPITPLRHLLLAGNRIGPAGIDALCSALSFTPIHILEVGLHQQNTSSIATSEFDPTTCRRQPSAAPVSHANLSSLWHHSAAIGSQEAEMSSFSISRYDLEGTVILFTLLGLMLWVIRSTRLACWTTMNEDSPKEAIETTPITPSTSTRSPFSSWICCSFFKPLRRPNPSTGSSPHLEAQSHPSLMILTKT